MNPDTTYISNPFKLLGPSWRAVKLNLGTLILSYLLIFGLVAVPAFIGGFVFILGAHFQSSAVTIVSVLFGLLALGALVYVILRLSALIPYVLLQSAHGKAVGLKEAINASKSYSGRVVLYQVGAGLGTLAGLLLFVIPGIIFATWWSFGAFLILEDNLRAGDAFGKSKALVQPRFWEVLGVNAAAQLFQVFNLIPFVGWVATFAFGVAYAAAGPLRYLGLRQTAANKTALPPVNSWNYLAPILAVVVVIAVNVVSFEEKQKEQSAPTPGITAPSSTF